jgi:hypothetical protein
MLSVTSNIINYGNIEQLLVTANTTNTIFPNCKSLNYPNDDIYIDWFSTSINGKIIRRIDNINLINVPFDFRNNKVRLYSLNVPTWTSNTSYVAGQILTYN